MVRRLLADPEDAAKVFILLRCVYGCTEFHADYAHKCPFAQAAAEAGAPTPTPDPPLPIPDPIPPPTLAAERHLPAGANDNPETDGDDGNIYYLLIGGVIVVVGGYLFYKWYNSESPAPPQPPSTEVR